MKINKRLFGRKTNRYFNYRTGAINTGRSIMSMVFVPVFVFMVVGSGALAFYVIDHRDANTINANIDEPEIVTQKEQADVDTFGKQIHTAKEDDQLRRAINDKIDNLPSGITWSVAVRDINSGRMANINSSQSMPGYGLTNIFELEQLEQRLVPDWWDSWIYSRSVNNCVIDLVQKSDQQCKKEIGNYVGWEKINTSVRENGFDDTSIKDGDSTHTSAKDISELLYRLQNSMMLSDKTRRMVFDGLYGYQGKSAIAESCGSECLVASQTADADSYKYDASIVTHGYGQYVVVVMTKNAGWEDIVSLAKSIDLLMVP